MFTIHFHYDGYGWKEVAAVDGCEAAYTAYKKACELAELVGADACSLVDMATGEVVADTRDEDFH